MKKLVSLLLTLALALTLAVPALAVDVNSPDYQAGFENGWNAGYDEGYYAGYDEGYSDGSGYEPTDFDNGYSVGWEDGYTWGLEAGADAAAEGVYAEQPYAPIRDDYENCTYEDGYEDGCMDGYAAGYEDGFYNATGLWGYEAQALTDKGGVIGQVNVLFDGECIDFPDVAPKIVNDRTMIPVRAVSEGLDMLVDWDDDTQTVTIGSKLVERTVSLTIGSKTATVTTCSGAEPVVTEIPMDCAPYLDNHRTMVPVRFLSEALGYIVLWDDQFQTVVVVDENAAAEAIDSKFTMFNNLAASQNAANPLGDKFQMDYDVSGAVTMYDETGKATVSNLSMDMTLATDSKSFRVDMTLNLKDMMNNLSQNPDLFEGMEVNVKDFLSIDWSKVTATVIMDEQGQCWANVPALNLLVLDAEKDAWLDLGSLNELLGIDGSVPSGGMNVDGLMKLPKNASLGRVLVTMCACDEGSFYFEDTLASIVQVLEPFYGDSAAKGNKSSCTWTLNGGELLNAIGFSKETLADMGWDKVDLSGKMTMSAKGDNTFQYDLRMDSELYSAVTGSLTGSGTAERATAKLAAAMDDLFDLKFTATCKVKALDTLPAFAPPADAELLNLDDYLADFSPAED